MRLAVRLPCCLLCLATICPALQRSWLDVPFVRQEEKGCGAACVAMVMQYWNRNAGQPGDPDSLSREIFKELYSEAAQGIQASDLESYLRRQRYQVYSFKGEWRDLAEQLAKGRPLIVGIKQSSGASPNHFVVVAGLDRGEDLILVNDPARRKLTALRRDEFERGWRACGNWTLLALPPK